MKQDRPRRVFQSFRDQVPKCTPRRLWYCTFQSFRDQVPKCTTEKARRRQGRDRRVHFQVFEIKCVYCFAVPCQALNTPLTF